MHLRQLAAASAPVLAALGDSTTTPASAVSSQAYMLPLLADAIRRHYPGRPLTIRPFGIGGTQWANGDGIYQGGLQPLWYPGVPQQRTVPWLDLVAEAAPDVVLLNWGINDGARFNLGAMRSVVAKLGAFPKRPDLVFVTNALPAATTSDQHAKGFASRDVQEGRDMVAGYIRSYARLHGHALLDQHRRFVTARDGFDPCAGMMTVHATDQTATLPYALPPCTDFEMKVLFAGGRPAFAEGARLACQVGNQAGNRLLLDLDASGAIALTVMASAEVEAVPRVITGFVPASLRNLNFGIAVRDTSLTVLCNSVVIWDGLIEKFGGLFRPTLRWENAAPAAVTVLRAAIGVPMPCMPFLTDRDIYGREDLSDPRGGNGLNHMTSLGLRAIIGDVIAASRFA
jgi:hypothetical protein